MSLGQSEDQIRDRLGLGADNTQDQMTLGPLEVTTPGTRVVIVDVLVGDVTEFRVASRQLIVEGVDRPVGPHSREIACAQLRVEC